jgi:hypothetical protein
VIVWALTDKELVVSEAVVVPSLVLTPTGLPAFAPSIINWTVPLGVPPPGATTLMVAIKMRLWPKTKALTDEPTTMLVLAWFTLWVRPFMLAAKLESPE